MPSLADIPFLSGYTQQNAINQQQGAQQLQQVGLLAQLQQQMQKAAKEQQYRQAVSGLGENPTEEQLLGISRQFAGPGDLMKSITSSRDRKEARDQTRQTALANLGQKIATEARHAYEFAQTLPLKERQAALAEINSRSQNAYRAGSLAIQAGNLNYNTGADVSGIGDIVSQLRSASQASAPAQTIPDGLQADVQGSAPTDQAAIAMVEDAARRGQTASVLGPVPGATPAPPTAPVAAPASAQGATPTDFNQRPGVPAPAAGAPTAAVMPTFTGSPRDVAQAQNKWRLEQAKAAALGGGGASEEVVKAIVEGRMQVPTGFALRSPYWQDVIQRVAKQDPNFDATKYGARAAARRTFARGPEARNVTALNTVIGHLGTLDEAASALNNKDLRAFNVVANRLATELGDPRIQNFDTAKQAVAEETMRVFRQVGASEMEARMWGERINASGSPAQLRGVIGTLGKLLESRVDAIGQQFERTITNTGNPARVDPANKATLGRLIKQGEGGVAPFNDGEKERRYQEWKSKHK